MKNLKSLICFLIFLSGCAQYKSQTIDQASQNLTNSLGCGDMKSQVFDAFYELIDQDQTVPSSDVLKGSLAKQLEDLIHTKNLSLSEAEKVNQIKLELFKVIDLMLTQSADLTSADWKAQIQKIIQYEMEDQSSSQIIASHTQVNQSLAQVKTLSDGLNLSCQTQGKNQDQRGATAAPMASAPLTAGLNRVVATAYQSCRVLNLPPIDRDTMDVVGITRLATNHPDGIGGQRVITDLKAVQNTHYYIRGLASESSCLPVRNNPLIYDYGGEPAVSKNTLNFFTDSGTGTKVLGIDCSAFISSAIAVSGFRYKPNLANKPIYTRMTSSSFINAQQSGFSCFDNVTVTPKQSIKPGDIVAVKGHVVAIDRIGADPFGLVSVKNVSECANLNYKNFDIDVAQSSPSKNGIGINKYKIKDYLDEGSKMREAFVRFGEQACLARFQNKNLKPINTEWGIIRHNGQTQCLAPRVTMVGEACTQACL